MPKNTVHGGVTDITYPPHDPRIHGDRPTIEPVDKSFDEDPVGADDDLDTEEPDVPLAPVEPVLEPPPVDKSIDEVKAWVGDDTGRAARALDAERVGKNRSGLVAWLEKVAATG